ncbi:MAG: hypothetical protein LBO69_02755 [Ignavibacteria bacterium]|jgi:hypothetical protein|nr:hypothetical protein [Ignavibacteria bacterium]
MKKYICIFAFLLLSGCVDDPSTPPLDTFVVGTDGVMVLCEGVRNTDKGSITRIDFSTGSFSNNYFSACNPDLKLGDVAEDMVICDTICIISVSGAGCINIISMNSGKLLDRLVFPSFVMPRKLCVINDTLAFVTAYIEMSGDDFYVYYFNPQDMVNSQLLLNEHCIRVGSHPEGIAFYRDLLFITNSGYGDFQYTNPTAATISVIDINAKQVVNTLKTGDNPNRIYEHNGNLYVACWGLPSDTTGKSARIIEYDGTTLSEKRSWNIGCYDMCFLGDTLFFLNNTMRNTIVGTGGVYYIPLRDEDAVPHPFIVNTQQYEIWTALAIDTATMQLWIGNSFRYTTAAELNVYDLHSPNSISQHYTTGIIPNTIKFYHYVTKK